MLLDLVSPIILNTLQQLGSAGPASGKKTQTKGAIGLRAAGLREGVSLETRAGVPETRGEA